MEQPRDWDQLRDQEIWNVISAGINPFIRVLSIDGPLFRSFEPRTKSFIAEQFIKHVREGIMYCRDGTGKDRYFLGSPRHFVADGGVILASHEVEPIWILQPGFKYEVSVLCQPVLPRKNIKIPRPPNAYILYRKDRHSMVKKGNPKLTNNEVSQILGRSWNLEPPEIRQRYKEMSEKIKKALMEKHPQYQYQPRKPSERKRRLRRRRPQDGESQESETTSTPDSNPATSEFATSPESVI